VVSSIYDPLGFVSPFVLVAKTILQDLCRSNLGWDEQISEDALHRWQNWLSMLSELERMFSAVVSNLLISVRSLHASCIHSLMLNSQKGYGAVTYLRILNQRGDIHCCFLIGKSRLAPLKAITIPRLELHLIIYYNMLICAI
jgi:hypothetical protein